MTNNVYICECLICGTLKFLNVGWGPISSVKTPGFPESVTEGDIRWEKGTFRYLAPLYHLLISYEKLLACCSTWYFTRLVGHTSYIRTMLLASEVLSSCCCPF